MDPGSNAKMKITNEQGSILNTRSSNLERGSTMNENKSVLGLQRKMTKG